MKERVCIAQRPLKDGVVSLFLDYRIGGKRRRENLKLYLVPERYASDKAKNAETMRIAKARRDDRAYELEQAEAGVIVKARPRLVLFRDVAKTLSERSGIAEGTRNCINKVCLKVEKCTPGVSVQECDSKWFEKVLNKMRAEGLKSNTIHTYSTIIRQVLHKAYKDGFIQAVPPFELPKFQNPIRTFLTLEELQRLDSTPFNLDVRDAFLFCCFTGLRYSDCKALTPAMIQGDTIVLRQKKTGDVVRIPLTANARKYLPERPHPNGKYFKFTYSFYVIAKMCDWARRAGIDKHITFHVSRHTFATLLITSGADVFATSKLLGHSSVETTQIYAHMVDDVRRKSVELIPSIEAKNEERT